jgi:hypothetical protein
MLKSSTRLRATQELTLESRTFFSRYGQCNLSPAGSGVEYALNYTLGLADLHPHLSAVMVDNAFWQYNRVCCLVDRIFAQQLL